MLSVCGQRIINWVLVRPTIALTQLQPSTQNKPLINRFLKYTYFFYCYLSYSLCLSNWPLKSSCNFVLADITSSNQNPHTVINWHNYLNWTRIFFVAKWQADSEAKDIKYSLLFTLPSIKIRTTNKKQRIKIYQSIYHCSVNHCSGSFRNTGWKKVFPFPFL